MSVNKLAEEEKEDKQSERAQGGPRDNCETVHELRNRENPRCVKSFYDTALWVWPVFPRLNYLTSLLSSLLF